MATEPAVSFCSSQFMTLFSLPSQMANRNFKISTNHQQLDVFIVVVALLLLLSLESLVCKVETAMKTDVRIPKCIFNVSVSTTTGCVHVCVSMPTRLFGNAAMVS